MFKKNQKRLQRSLCISCFVIFGFGYSQDQGTIETFEKNSISGQDSKEEEQIRNVFFNDEVLEDINPLPEPTTTSSVKPLGSIESSDVEDIYKTRQQLKEKIQQLQLEQQRIETILLAKEKGFALNSDTQHPPNSIDISSELPINPKAIDSQKEVDPYKVVKLVSQEEAERALLVKKKNLANTISFENSNDTQNKNDLSRTPSYAKKIDSSAVSQNNTPLSKIVTAQEGEAKALNPNTYLLKETIDSSNNGALKIRRVFVEPIGQQEADLALKNKTKIPDSILNLELASVSFAQKVRADFNGDRNEFFAHICTVNPTDESTTICFEHSKYPPLVVSNAIGGHITSLKLKGSDRDYLLFTANTNDEQFAKYFLFVLRNNEWKPVMNSFCIHKSNLSSALTPIRVDPNRPDKLLRYYSVFDLDEANLHKSPWKLEQESVKKTAW